MPGTRESTVEIGKLVSRATGSRTQNAFNQCYPIIRKRAGQALLFAQAPGFRIIRGHFS